MRHLSSERLAALPDNEPTSAERTHMAACEGCAGQYRAFQHLLANARAERVPTGLPLPLTRWDSLVSALGASGLVGGRTGRASGGWRTWRHAAAAMALIAGGMAAGRVSAGPLPDRLVAGLTTVPEEWRDTATPSFRSVADAREARARFELLYAESAAYLAAHESSAHAGGSPASMRTRLAALDRVGETIRAAMHVAPYDPVINGFYLTTMGQREATLRQLNATLPASVRIDSF